MQKLLRDEAREIWLAGVHAVRGDRLIRAHVAVQNQRLIVGSHRWLLAEIDRLCVVGAGKAGASMAHGLEQALGDSVMEAKQLSGWINVPADCVRPLRRIQLHAARPAGVNEPTREGQAGAEEILRRVAELHERDLCLCLLSGGGSALMPAPRPGVTLDQKLQITRHLSAAGANIQQLNAVRRQLSMIKGGGLARACTAGRLVSLIISDVLGDPLDVIASGPTVIPPNAAQAARDALQVLEQFPAARRDRSGPADGDRATGRSVDMPFLAHRCAEPGDRKQSSGLRSGRSRSAAARLRRTTAGTRVTHDVGRGSGTAIGQRTAATGQEPGYGPNKNQDRYLPDQRRRAGRTLGRHDAARPGRT